MNYYEIGQRIRKFRKAHQLSQEELAERIGISTTHMSHIETGNTKLSLPVLVSLATALEVSADDLLFDNTATTRNSVIDDLLSLLENCSISQIKILKDIVKKKTARFFLHGITLAASAVFVRFRRDFVAGGKSAEKTNIEKSK